MRQRVNSQSVERWDKMLNPKMNEGLMDGSRRRNHRGVCEIERQKLLSFVADERIWENDE
jgi:hypothetical protein